LYLNVDYKALVIKIRHAVLKIFEQLYKIFEQLFQILATFEQLFGIFLSNVLPFSEQNLDAPICSIQEKLCDMHTKTADLIPCIYCISKSSNMSKFAASAEIKQVLLLLVRRNYKSRKLVIKD